MNIQDIKPLADQYLDFKSGVPIDDWPDLKAGINLAAAVDHRKALHQLVQTHCYENFMVALAFLQTLGNLTSADEAHDLIVNSLPELLDKFEEVHIPGVDNGNKKQA